jgi:hypothetical protein
MFLSYSLDLLLDLGSENDVTVETQWISRTRAIRAIRGFDD